MWHLPLPAVTRWGGWTCKFRARQRFSRFLRPGMSDLTSALSSGPGLLGDSQVSDTPTCILDTSFLKCFLTDPTWGSVWCWITEPLISTRGDWMTKLYTVLFDMIKKKVFGYQMFDRGECSICHWYIPIFGEWEQKVKKTMYPILEWHGGCVCCLHQTAKWQPLLWEQNPASLVHWCLTRGNYLAFVE